MEILPILLGLGIAAVVGLLSARKYRERGEAWQAAAAAAGLTEVQTSTAFLGHISKVIGQSGALQVTIESYRRGKQESGTRIIVDRLRHGAYALTIRPEGMSTLIEKTFGERELEVGEGAFDSEAYIQGAPALVRALFDAETRAALREALQGRLRVKTAQGSGELEVRTHITDNQLIVNIRERPFADTHRWIPGALRILVELGHRLARPADLGEKIAVNALQDPIPDVRLANIQTLIREFPEHPATRPTCLKALADSSPEVRLLAAMTAGSEGRETLQQLALMEDGPDSIAAQAIAAVGTDLSLHQLRDRLQRAVQSGSRAAALACIELLGRAGLPAGVETLASVVSSENLELSEAAARNLGLLGTEAAETALLAILDHDSPQVRIAAAEALARCGTPRAVQPLHRCSGAHPLDVSLRRATRQAIAEIQARLTGASPGQLSLSGEASGQVSLVEEDARGRLTLDQYIANQKDQQSS